MWPKHVYTGITLRLLFQQPSLADTLCTLFLSPRVRTAMSLEDSAWITQGT